MHAALTFSLGFEISFEITQTYPHRNTSNSKPFASKGDSPQGRQQRHARRVVVTALKFFLAALRTWGATLEVTGMYCLPQAEQSVGLCTVFVYGAAQDSGCGDHQ